MTTISITSVAPLDNGMSIFIMGILFILSLSNFFLFFQNKNKIYLVYSIYTFLILLDQFKINGAGFLGGLSSYFNDTSLDFVHRSLEWSYNTFYTIFGLVFIDIRAKSKGWYHAIKAYVILSFTLLLVAVLMALLRDDLTVLNYGFVYYNILLGILIGIPIIYYALKFKIKGNILFIIGSILFVLFSLLAFFLDSKFSNYGSWVFFYMGIIFENLFFTLALGKRQKNIMIQKNIIQEEFINQLKENDRLKAQANTKLETKIEEITQEIQLLNKQAKDEEVNKIKITYEKRLADLKVQALQAQMNPHFIFNSLNSIKLHIINNEKEAAVYYLNKFSKLIRSILTTMRKRTISLSEELQTMNLYVEIEKIRFSDQLHFEIQIEEGVSSETIKLPPLILQPFIENAIWHGLSPSKKQRRLKISIKYYHDTHIEIIVCDNGIGRKRSWEINAKKTYKRESIGIALTEERLQTFSEDYANNYYLNFIDHNCFNECTGTQIILRIPIK